MILSPFGARVIVECTDDEVLEKTKGGILLPDTSNVVPAHEGVVLAIGDAVCWVKVGDIVLWGKHAGTILRPKGIMGDKIIEMDEEDLLCRADDYETKTLVWKKEVN